MTYYGAKELADSFRTVRKNTITIAEEIPEEHYTFRATPDTRTVAEMLAHIAVSTFGWHEAHAKHRIMTFVGVDFPAWIRQQAEEERKLQTKAQILDALRRSGELWAGWLESVSEEVLAERVTYPPEVTPPSKSRFEVILGAKEHEMHHRGQLMLMQRMLGIVPHLTRRFQQMMTQTTAGSPAR